MKYEVIADDAVGYHLIVEDGVTIARSRSASSAKRIVRALEHECCIPCQCGEYCGRPKAERDANAERELEEQKLKRQALRSKHGVKCELITGTSSACTCGRLNELKQIVASGDSDAFCDNLAELRVVGLAKRCERRCYDYPCIWQCTFENEHDETECRCVRHVGNVLPPKRIR